MKTPFEPSRLLDRGGEPTVRELLSRLVFNPTDGTIRLNGDRVVMQRAAVGVELRRELIRLLGPQEARIFLMRLGFLSGQADARFVRTSWPNLDIGDAFTAGTRLHTFSGVVRVETVYNDFDFRKKRFAGEFLWHDSVEAAEFRRLRRKTTEPVCWTQLGYASGYASEFFDTLIVYKEVACCGPGASPLSCGGKAGRCLGAGRPGSDPVSGTHRGPAGGRPARAAQEGCRPHRRERAVRARPPHPCSSAGRARQAGADGLARHDHRLARHRPQPCGTVSASRLRHVGKRSRGMCSAARVDLDLCAEIARRGKGGRRGAAGETILIDAAEKIPAEVQPHLARSIEEGMLVGGPRVLALVEFDPTAGLADPPLLSSELWYALSALTIRMPTTCRARGRESGHCTGADAGARCKDGPAIRRRSTGRQPRPLSARTGRGTFGRCARCSARSWPRTAMTSPSRVPRSRRSCVRFRSPSRGRRRYATRAAALLDRLLEEGGFSLSELERSAYEAAVDRTAGNLVRCRAPAWPHACPARLSDRRRDSSA